MANTKSNRGRGSKGSDGVLAHTDIEGSQRGIQGGKDSGRKSEQSHFGRDSTVHGQPREEESPVESRMGIHLSDGLSTPLAELDLGIDRVGADIPDRAKKLKAIGNAIVPDIPEVIMRIMINDEES